LTLIKKTGRITPYNPSIFLEKTGFVTYSVPNPEIFIKYRIHIEFKNINNFAYFMKYGVLPQGFTKATACKSRNKKSPYGFRHKGIFYCLFY